MPFELSIEKYWGKIQKELSSEHGHVAMTDPEKKVIRAGYPSHKVCYVATEGPWDEYLPEIVNRRVINEITGERMDWYNLEKSKRVKPFHCGEFDECIEKAESALGMPPKKREKYARREDAILHALELEKQLLGDKSGNFGSQVDGYCEKSSETVKKESVISSECVDYDTGKNVNLKPDSKKLVVSTEDEDVNDPICPPEGNGVSQMELLPHVSGSQGLGLRSARAKQKHPSSNSLNGSGKLELDSFDHDLPISDLIYESSVIPVTRRSLEKKRKAADDALTNESPVVKRRDRRRTLVQVLQKSEKLPSKSSLQVSREVNIEPISHTKMQRVYFPSESDDCYDNDQLVSPNQMVKSPSHVEVDNFSCPTALDEDIASESTESTESDSSKTDSMDSDKVGLAEPTLLPEMEPEISGQLRHGSMSSMMPNDNDYDMSHLYSHDPVPASLGVSKWQSKGKRNNRSLSRKSSEATDRWVARGSMYTADLEEVERESFNEIDVIKRNCGIQKHPYYDQGYVSTSKSAFKGYDDVSPYIIDWEDLAWNKPPLMRGYWEGTSNHLSPTHSGHRFGGRMKSGLVDVDVKVQTSYQREHVPMISLMSKLNGKAIVGHPIQVQILDYGSTDSLLSLPDGSDLENPDNDKVVPTAWRTARRSSNIQVPGSQLLTTTEGEESTEHFQNSSHKKMLFRKSGMGNFSHNSSVKRKGISHGKFSKKPPKKMSSTSNQKIRNLSAIGREQRFGSKSKSGNETSFQADGLIKGEAGPTTVACIPVKLVFCRLNEELVDRNKT